MPAKTVTATQFKAKCLRLIDEMGRDGEPVIVTRHGKPVARLVPVDTAAERPPLFGSMKGTVLRYDDPFGPAIDPDEWHALR